jgi:hypothetical protein
MSFCIRTVTELNSGLKDVPNITDLFLKSGVKHKGGEIVLKSCGYYKTVAYVKENEKS